MKLAFVQIDKLCVSRLNMRYARKAPDVSDILPTVRARGVLQPIIVRPCSNSDGETGHHEILAGARRFHAAQIIEQESAEQAGHEPAQLPCAILEEGDDAAAIEASLIENSARLDPDEVSRWECFIRLIREGRKPADIAATFGLPDLSVKRILALGNLLPRIRDLYRREEIDAGTVRHLTLASKTQQKAWLALLDDPDAYAPKGFNLKGWLFGGQSIPTKHALFDVGTSGLATVADRSGKTAISRMAAHSGQRRMPPSRRNAPSIWKRAGLTRLSSLPTPISIHGSMRRRARARAGASILMCARTARSSSMKAISAAGRPRGLPRPASGTAKEAQAVKRFVPN